MVDHISHPYLDSDERHKLYYQKFKNWRKQAGSYRKSGYPVKASLWLSERAETDAALMVDLEEIIRNTAARMSRDVA